MVVMIKQTKGGIQIFKYYITSKNTTGGGVCIKSQKSVT